MGIMSIILLHISGAFIRILIFSEESNSKK